MTAHTHPSEEDLILHFYGESSHRAAIHAHLALCSPCQSEYEAIARTLTLVATPAAPERGDLYGLEVWQRIRPLLPAQDRWSRFLRVRWSTLTMGAAVAVFAIAAFIAGRYWPSKEQPASTPMQAANPGVGGDARARTVAIIDHLERSERVLLDLTNADGPDVDVSEEQAWAADLVAAIVKGGPPAVGDFHIVQEGPDLLEFALRLGQEVVEVLLAEHG